MSPVPGGPRPAAAGRESAVLAAARERQRLADRMHDDVAPLLLAAQLRLAVALEHTGALPEVARIVERAQALIVECESRIHRVVTTLDADRVVPALALEDRLGVLIAELEARFALTVRLRFDARVGTDRPALSEAQAALVVAAVREGIVNAARHARAVQVAVDVARPRRRSLRVRVENAVAGPGTAERGPGLGGHGLRSLRRAVAVHGGTVALTVVPARSATLTVELPLPDRAVGGLGRARAD